MDNPYAVELREVTKHFGTLAAVDNISLQIQDGEFFSLLGPSGCGKTTTLRLIAGFELPTKGEVLIGGESQGYLPAYKRPVNTVFQHYALFPHMTVYKNVAFGLDMQGVSKADSRRRVYEALEMVHLEGMERRRPKQLSGGQRQRVALARALVNRPKVLLLDEPLGALDLKLRKAMQIELKSLQDQVGITFIYVTHDQEEALTMSDRIGVMDKGALLQVDPPQAVYEKPATRFIADFIGDTNYLEGEIVEAGDSVIELILPDAQRVTSPPRDGILIGQRVSLGFRPEKVVFNPSEKLRYNRLEKAQVVDIVYTGSTTGYIVETQFKTKLHVRQQNTRSSSLEINIGDQVVIGWPVEACQLFVS